MCPELAARGYLNSSVRKTRRVVAVRGRVCTRACARVNREACKNRRRETIRTTRGIRYRMAAEGGGMAGRNFRKKTPGCG